MQCHVVRVLFTISLCGLIVAAQPKRTFTLEDDRFVRDGKATQLISGSVHYHRIPVPYWRDRLLRVRSMGLNTIELYIPWNYHERFPGEYTWDGMADVFSFIELIQELDMLVLLRVGPYICAEWDFGGLPWWLGSSQVVGGGKMHLRSSDPDYLEPVNRWFDVLLPKVAPYLYQRGGPVAMVQLENEYGFIGKADDKHYMRHLVKLARKALGDEIVLFTTDPPPNVEKGSLPDDEIFSVVDFGPGWYNLSDAFGAQRKYNAPGKSPPLCAEFYPGWLVHWGEKMANTSAQVLTNSFSEILAYANGTASVNFYMAHGGTNFGWTAGAGIALYGEQGRGESYQAHITSYDYDCMVSEAGQYGQPGIGGPNKYQMIQDAVKAHTGVDPPDSPPPPTIKAYGQVDLKQSVPLLEALPQLWPGDGIISRRPLPMEEYGQGGGLTLYRTHIRAAALQNGAELDITHPVHDYARVLVEGKVVASLDRNKGAKVSLLLLGIDTADKSKEMLTLDILVEAIGRDNSGSKFDFKGLVSEDVYLNGDLLQDWRVFPLELKDTALIPFPVQVQPHPNTQPTPTFYRGTFTADAGLKSKDGILPDTFMAMPSWAKGVAFINGFNLGWYWPKAGPQMTMYIPGPMLRDGENELILLEVEETGEKPTVTLGDTPNFYGPEPKEQQIDQQGGVLRTSMRRGHAEMNSQAWQFFEDDTDPYGQQHMMQQ
ncbi:hypothetical protein ABBQ38_007978 [Trebouxia sp. C0009 RCD-2024]